MYNVQKETRLVVKYPYFTGYDSLQSVRKIQYYIFIVYRVPSQKKVYRERRSNERRII